MAKSKKASSNSSSYSKKKIVSSTNKKPSSRLATKLDNKKVEKISKHISKINNSFEFLIAECQIALKQLSTN